jgi:hypothetical protein
VEFADLMQVRHVDFLGVKETEENTLRLYFCRTKILPEPLVIGDLVYQDAGVFVADEQLPVIQVEFQTYIGYSIRNESYTVWDDTEEFEGKWFRIYTKSKYLSFIAQGTVADDVYPGPFKHYGMACFDHIVDVVSTSAPKVTEIKTSQPG